MAAAMIAIADIPEHFALRERLFAAVRRQFTELRVRKDRVHLRDLIEVGLVDAGWLGRLPLAHAERLKSLLDTPEG